MIVVNSARAATELLEQKSSIYSDRPRFVMLNELFVTLPVPQYASLNSDSINCSLRANWSFAFMPYGDSWREHSRLFHQFFNQRVTKTYSARIANEVRTTLGRLSQSPSDFLEHFRQYVSLSTDGHTGRSRQDHSMAGSLILSTTYGIKVQPNDDPYIAIAERGLKAIEASARAGAYLGAYLAAPCPSPLKKLTRACS